MTKFSNTAVYAFVAWIASILAFASFIVWAMSTDEFLHMLGITYYPNRYYAIALPSFAIVAYIFTGILYIGFNMMTTHDPENILTFMDSHSSFFRNGASGSGANGLLNSFVSCSVSDGIPDISDIHPKQISLAVLHQNKKII